MPEERKEKFSPGPWTIEKRNPFCFLVYSGDHLVASVGADGSLFSAPNAHMIAAAPKMYGILDKLSLALAAVPVLHVEIEKVLKEARGEAENAAQ